MGKTLQRPCVFTLFVALGCAGSDPGSAMKKSGMIFADNGSDFYFQGEANRVWTEDDMRNEIFTGRSEGQNTRIGHSRCRQRV